VITTGEEVRDLFEARWQRLGYDQLLPVEKDYLLVWWLNAEASNGSLHQYFYNSTGDAAAETVAALERLGASQAQRVLTKAMAAFEPAGYTCDRMERIKRLDSIPNSYDVFGHLTEELFAGSDEDIDIVSNALDRVGDTYNELKLDADMYEQTPPLRLAASALLVVLLVGLVAVVVVMVFRD
jgi:hypothetical protein